MNTGNRVYAAALAIALATALAACNRQSQPKTGDLSSSPRTGGMSGRLDNAENVASDTAITALIKVALLRESDLKSADISVDTREGRVTLTGSVPEARQADRAAKVAGGIDGVRDVENKLTVKSAS